MSKAVNSKWKKTFPDTIGNQNRPATGVDDTQEFETGAFPQYMANDPVRYDLQNAAMSQLMSNDARLKEMVDARGKELDDHKVDPGAHKTGIAGNAATATKVVTTAATGASANIAEASMGGSDSARIRVSGAENAGELVLETANDGDEAIVARQYTGVYTNAVRTAKILDESGNTSFPGTVVAPKFTGTLNGNASTATKLATPRTLSLSGKAAGSTTFDGSANVTINVTSVNADTASKLSTARKISITGNATGAASFDGSGNVSINTTVNESKHADKATTVNATAPNGGAADLAFGTMAVNDYARIRVGGKDDNGWLELATADGGNEPIYARQYGGAYDWPNGRPGTVKNEAVLLDGNGNTKFPHDVTAANFKGHLAGNADSATTATKLATARTINITGDATGAATFDGSTDISISTTVNESKHAAAADNDGNGANIANTYLKKATVIDVIYPVGSIYMSMSATNPHDLFGVGTWERISQGRMLLGADDSTYKAGATGGEAAHTLTANEMPAHSHSGTTSTNGDHSHGVRDADYHDGYGNSFDSGDWGPKRYIPTSNAGNHNHTFTTDNAGGGAAHNNMPPYLVCYMWQRTA